MPLLIYLIPYKERFLKRTGVWAICPRAGCAEACWVISWDHSLLQIFFPEKQSGPFVLQEASHRKQQPSLLVQSSGCGLGSFVSLL